MINVTCVNVGNKFSDDYVRILKAMVEKNTTIEHNFLCYSDHDIENVEVIKVPGIVKGWWNKLHMFESPPAHYHAERTVYFDLDTAIISNIDWLMEYDSSSIIGLENLGILNSKYEDITKYVDHFQSGVMSWNTFECKPISQIFFSDPQKFSNQFRGDGEFLDALLDKNLRKYIQREFPGKLTSYKYDAYENGITDDLSIICFHGQPSPYEAIHETVSPWGTTYEPREWVGDYWKA